MDKNNFIYNYFYIIYHVVLISLIVLLLMLSKLAAWIFFLVYFALAIINYFNIKRKHIINRPLNFEITEKGLLPKLLYIIFLINYVVVYNFAVKSTTKRNRNN